MVGSKTTPLKYKEGREAEWALPNSPGWLHQRCTQRFLSHCRNNLETREGGQESKARIYLRAVRSQRERGQFQVNSYPVSLASQLCGIWKWKGRIFIGEVGLGVIFPDFHPEERRDLCPYLILIRSVIVSVLDEYFSSARLVLLYWGPNKPKVTFGHRRVPSFLALLCLQGT